MRDPEKTGLAKMKLGIGIYECPNYLESYKTERWNVFSMATDMRTKRDFPIVNS